MEAYGKGLELFDKIGLSTEWCEEKSAARSMAQLPHDLVEECRKKASNYGYEKIRLKSDKESRTVTLSGVRQDGKMVVLSIGEASSEYEAKIDALKRYLKGDS
jgi:hypothetical protein